MSSLLVAFIDDIRRQVTAKRDVYHHDGIGNPIVSVDLYLKTALEACEEIERLQTLLDCRAGKLLQKGKYFLCVANDEPYFSHVYDLIRTHEMRVTKRWSDEDEAIYQREMRNWDWPKQAQKAAEAGGEG